MMDDVETMTDHGRTADPDALGTALRLLGEQVGREHLLTEGPGYDAARQVWNAGVDIAPALIVRCASTADVQAAVRAARASGLTLSVLGGGYDWVGRALAQGGLVIDLTLMRGVRVEGDVAIAQGGARISDVLDAAAPHGLSAATGTVGAVGMAGLTMGGGYGRLSGRAGLAADNLLGASVVLATGEVVVADPEHEDDLFWALRGAGGNFGVVIELRIALHPVTEVFCGLVTFPRSQARSVLAGLRDLLAEDEDDLTPIFGLMVGPEEPLVYVSPTWSGEASRGEAVMDRVRALGDAVDDQLSRMSVAASVHLVDEQFGPGAHATIRTRSVPALDDAVIEALIAAADAFPSQRCAVNVHHVHGAVTRLPSDATAFGLRHEHFVVEILPSWTDGTGDAELGWADTTARSLDPYALPGGYANIMGDDDAERAGMSYGDNAGRVLELKHRYDPDGTFRSITLPAA